MPQAHELGVVILRLSTGYEVEVDLEKTSTVGWRRHLARAILGERVLAEARQPQDRTEPGWHLDAIPEEVLYLLATTPAEVKDLLLYQLFFEDITKLVDRLNREVAKGTAMATTYRCELEDDHIAILDAERSVGRSSELLDRVVVDQYLIATFYPELTGRGRRRVFRRGTLNAPAVSTNTFADGVEEGDTLDTYEAELVREVAWGRVWQAFLRAHPEIKVAHTGGFEFEAEVLIEFEHPLAFNRTCLAIVRERVAPFLKLLESVSAPHDKGSSRM